MRYLNHILSPLSLETLGDGLLGVDKLAETEPWCVDWRLASVDKCVVEEAAEKSATERGYDRDPEVMSTCRPHVLVSESCSHQSWSEVTSWVDGEAGLGTEGDSNAGLVEGGQLG